MSRAYPRRPPTGRTRAGPSTSGRHCVCDHESESVILRLICVNREPPGCTLRLRFDRLMKSDGGAVGVCVVNGSKSPVSTLSTVMTRSNGRDEAMT